MKTSPEEGGKAAWEVFNSIGRREDLLKNEKLKRTVWERMAGTADRFNQPGVFTAFVGYEWTSAPGGNNLHRVVIFRDDAARASQVVPFSAFDSPDPEDLWKYLAAYEEKTGGEVLAIPHNGNISNGLMFDEQTFTGKKLTRAYAQTRSRRPRATARRIPSSRPMTSLPTSSAGISATSFPCPRRTKC